MPTPAHRTPAVPARGAGDCMCSVGRACSSFAAGHAVHRVQARLVAATPGEWVDAIVLSADAASGSIRIRTFEEGHEVSLWNGAGGAAELRAGDPVALHERHNVLAIGSTRYNALLES